MENNGILMQQYKVSVIVPVHNEEKYLKFCVDSIRKQTYKNIEIILVDDGSKDGSGWLCDECQKEDSRIKVIHKENGGLVSAWMTGLLASTTDWVSFIDADDYMEEHHINTLVTEQNSSSADIVVLEMKQVFLNHYKWLRFESDYGKYSGEKLNKELFPHILNVGGFEKRGIPVSRCSKLIRKRLLLDNLKYEYPEATYEEDLNIMFPCLIDASSISLIKSENSAYCYRVVNDSMLHGYDSKMIDSVEHVYPLLRQAICDKNKKGIFNEQINTELVTATVRCYTNELKNPAIDKVAFENITDLVYTVNYRDVVKTVSIDTFPIKFKFIAQQLRHMNRKDSYVIFKCARKYAKYIK